MTIPKSIAACCCLLLSLGCFLAGQGQAAGEEDPLRQLAWLAGAWAGEQDGVESEESWIAPKGGLMLGVHRDLFPSGNTFFEFLRIEARDGEIYYMASPRGREPTPYRLAELADSAAVFANPEHDFPKRLSYSRTGNTLLVRAEGDENGKPRALEWRWNLVE